MKYLAFQVRNTKGGKNTYLTEAAWAEFIPAGWKPPRTVQYLDIFGGGGLSKPRVEPAVKFPDRIHLACRTVEAREVRWVSAEVEAKMDAIDAQILELQRKRTRLWRDAFCTFDFVKPGDLPESKQYPTYPTKAEADKHMNE